MRSGGTMRRRRVYTWPIGLCCSLLAAGPVQAFDSYRYLHVTIDTPWLIFMFLLPIVLSPFILMAWLYWRYAGRRAGDERSDHDQSQRRP